MLPPSLQDITPAAPASRDAKSCVSRADTAYFHRHTSAPPYSAKYPRETQNLASLLYLYILSSANIHTAISRKANSGDARFCVSTLFVHTFIGKHTRCHIAQSSLVRRKILRLYFICTYFHRQTYALPYSAKLTCETQNLASLLYLHALLSAHIRAVISRKANSGDARFCVSTLFAHTFIGTHPHRHIAQSSLGRRKILRLYFICTHFHWHTYALPYRAKLTRETQNLASLLYLHALSSAHIRAVISRKANSGDAKSCVSTFTIHLNKQNEAATNKPALKHT